VPPLLKAGAVALPGYAEGENPQTLLESSNVGGTASGVQGRGGVVLSSCKANGFKGDSAMAEFRFNIGDMVMAKATAEDVMAAAWCGILGIPKRMMVVGRLAEECPGGVQLHYGCASEGSRDKYHECELMPAAEFDAGKLLRAFIEGKQRVGGIELAPKKP
jgi:hypothetical protein